MTGLYTVVYSPEAKNDLFSIRRYIANVLHAKVAATRTAKRIRESIRALNTFPERHAPVDWEPWKQMQVRYFPVKNYIIYYTVKESEKIVTIIRIFYGGRDVRRLIVSESESTDAPTYPTPSPTHPTHNF